MLLGGIGVTLEMNPVYFCLQRSQKKKKEKPAWLFFWISLLPFFKYWLNHRTWHLHLTLRLTQVWGAHSRLPPTPALHPLWVYTAHETHQHSPMGMAEQAARPQIPLGKLQWEEDLSPLPTPLMLQCSMALSPAQSWAVMRWSLICDQVILQCLGEPLCLYPDMQAVLLWKNWVVIV